MRQNAPEPTRTPDHDFPALAARARRLDPAAAIRRDLLTLAELPGEDRIRAIYGLNEARNPTAAA